MVKHRRISPNGYHTAASDTLMNVALPATLTPQGYTDTSQLLRDEFLMSDDSGVTWRIVPRLTAPFTGPQVVDSFDTSWNIEADLSDNQLVSFTTIDFGTFSAGDEPTEPFWVYNDTTADFTSLSFEVRNSDSGSLYNELANRIFFQIVGQLEQGVVGTGDLATTAATVVPWNPPPDSVNSAPIVLSGGQAAKCSLDLENFPSTGLNSLALSANVEIMPNRTLFNLNTFGDWIAGTLWVTNSFPLPVIEDSSTAGNVTLKPFAFSVGSVAVVNWSDRLFPSPSGTVRLEVLTNGQFQIVDNSDPIDTSIAWPVATFDFDGALVTNLNLVCGIRGLSQFQTPADPPPTGQRFVTVNGAGELVDSSDSGVPLGVSVPEQPGYYVQTGLVLVESGGSISVGDTVGSSASGQAVTSPSVARGIAISSASGSGEAVLVSLGSVADSGGGGSTTFVGLTDTPATIEANQLLRGNSTGDALEFFNTLAIQDLSNVPALGAVGQVLAVAAGGTTTEWVNQSGGGGATAFTDLTDTVNTLGTAGQYAAMDSGATTIEFIDPPFIPADIEDLSNVPALGSVGQVLAVAANGTDTEWITAGGGGGSAYSGARISATGLPNAPAPNTDTTPVFTTVDFDTGSYADLVTNTDRLTVPSAGYYSVVFAPYDAGFGFSGTNNITLGLTIEIYNSSNVLLETYFAGVRNSKGNTIQTPDMLLSAGDYVIPKFQVSNVNGSPTNAYLSIHRIGT